MIEKPISFHSIDYVKSKRNYLCFVTKLRIYNLFNEFLTSEIFTVLDSAYRNRRWELEDDPGNDLDHHSEVRHPGHLSGGNDSQGGPAALVPEEDSTLQECQCPKLPPQVGFYIFVYAVVT